jgi:hypothetical protein
MAQEAFMEKFRACYLGDDLDTFMELMYEGAVWTFMATGETFKGREQIRERRPRDRWQGGFIRRLFTWS